MVTQFLKAYYFEILLCTFFSAVLLLFYLLTRLFIQRAMILPAKLVHDALQKENDGDFEEAEIGYRSALEKIESRRFKSSKLKKIIIEKIKLLNTVIEYKKMSKAST